MSPGMIGFQAGKAHLKQAAVPKEQGVLQLGVLTDSQREKKPLRFLYFLIFAGTFRQVCLARRGAPARAQKATNSSA